MPRIMPLLLPTADDIGAFLEFGQQVRYLSRIVLQVGIHRDDHFALRFVKARDKAAPGLQIR